MTELRSWDCIWPTKPQILPVRSFMDSLRAPALEEGRHSHVRKSHVMLQNKPSCPGNFRGLTQQRLIFHSGDLPIVGSASLPSTQAEGQATFWSRERESWRVEYQPLNASFQKRHCSQLLIWYLLTARGLECGEAYGHLVSDGYPGTVLPPFERKRPKWESQS